MASNAGFLGTDGSTHQAAAAAAGSRSDANGAASNTRQASQPSSSSSSSSSSTTTSSASSSAVALPAEMGDQWEYNKPVEVRCAALNEEMSDCLSCFWRWVTCGGPGARVRQLYVNGRLSRCMDDYTKFRNCLALKLNPDAEVQVLPGPHALWHIRTRRQAHEFWSAQYEHLGARRREVFGEEADEAGDGPRHSRRRQEQ